MWLLLCSFSHSASYIPSIIPHRHPTQALSFIRSFRSIPLISLLWAFVFPLLNTCRCSPVSLRYTKLHCPAQKPIIIHSLHSSAFSLSVRHLTFPTHAPNKNSASLAVTAAGSRPLFVAGFLLPAPLLHSQTARACASQNNLHFVPLFWLARSRLLYLCRF